jgi:mono/diheme cytochrome c family protein
MKRILKIAAIAVAAVVLAVAGILITIDLRGIPHYPTQAVDLHVEVTPERVARGKRTVESLCAACHLDKETGTLAGKRMPDLPTVFGEATSANITQDPDTGIGSWTDGQIAFLLRTGIRRDGRYTPPWMVKLPNMSDDDLDDVIAFLRSDDPLVHATKAKREASKPSLFTKLLCRVAFKPFPYPSKPIVAPAPTDTVAYGKYLVQGRLMCYACHSKDFAKVDDLVPERSAGYLGGGNPMPDLTGRIVKSANITPDADTGIGTWSEADFARTLRFGVRPDNTVVAYPMVPYPEVTEDEAKAIFAYLRTVPPIRNPIPRPEETVVAGADAGRAAYYRYGCNTCHGDTGNGLYDLRKAATEFPKDDDLVAYIKHPERYKPGVKMPTWDGVIADEDYAPLVAYVRHLCGESAPR